MREILCASTWQLSNSSEFAVICNIICMRHVLVCGGGLRGVGLQTCRPVSSPVNCDIISSASNSVLLMPWLLPQPSQVLELHMQAVSARVTSCANSGQESSFLALYSKRVMQPSAGLWSKYENVADVLS